MKSLIEAADLFCGAGGTSSGLALACKEIGKRVDLLAINHWKVAIQSHQANHPWARHMMQDIDAVDPRKAVPSGRLDILVASPSCTHFSMARGGKPVEDQYRASPWHIPRWLCELSVDNVLIENVPEFVNWAPLSPSTGKPIQSKKGETFKAWVKAIEGCGYRVEWRILNAADYGDATTRRRLFIMAKRGGRAIRWPDPTHTKENWRPARDVIDWNIVGESIFNRKRPLASKTLARIAAGLRKFCGKAAEPFLVMLYGTNDARSLERPMPSVTASGQHIALCEPFVLQQQSGGVPRSVENPLPAIATKGAQSLIQPFLVPFYGERDGQEPRTHSIHDPVPTIPASGDGKFGVVEPFLVQVNHGGGSSGRLHSVGDPLKTVSTKNGFGLAEPFIVKYFGTGVPHPVSEPLPTITTKDRVALVDPVPTAYGLDIRFRMLQPHELAAAMSFGKGYRFSGNRGDQVKQIGNAVPVMIAKALCSSLLAS